jgi:hypothetical protein
MLTGQDIHENYRIGHSNAIQWDEVSPRAKRLYEVLAQAIELEEQDVIVAVKCMKCNEMVSAYGYSEHVCTKSSNTYYCWDTSEGHDIGWFCKHPECKGE